LSDFQDSVKESVKEALINLMLISAFLFIKTPALQAQTVIEAVSFLC